MYKVRFDTKKFDSRKRRDWENQLMNDFAVAINGKEFQCKTDKELLQRLHFIDHSMHDNLFTVEEYQQFHSDENNYITLDSERYGERKQEISIYGIPQGYIDFNKKLEEVKQNKSVLIPFSSFYDLRQGNFFKGCFIEITEV